MVDGVEITVVVPVRDGAATLPACLDALAGQTVDGRVELIVVDNASRDATAAVAAAHAAHPSVIREEHRGSYAARNTGAAAARGRRLAFTDADCVPEGGWLAAGLRALDQGADLAGGAVLAIASAAPTVWEVYDRAVYLDQQANVDTMHFAATANLFVDRAVFESVGGFDAGLRSGGDVLFGRSATASGCKLVYAPDAVVQHRPRTTMRETWKLHRRLGAGWTGLARRGMWPSVRDDRALRVGLGVVAAAASADGRRIRQRELAVAHAVAMTARWTGRLIG